MHRLTPYHFGVLLVFLLNCGCGHTALTDPDRRYETTQAHELRQIAEAEADDKARSPDERKLQGVLYLVLRCAERTDTSARAQAIYLATMQNQSDGSGRLRVILTLGGTSAIDPVTAELKLRGAEVEDNSPRHPYIRCLVRPLALRQIIAIGSVYSVEIPTPGYHN
jgi:hypothetical protein